jgi:Protein of unknown function (DUF3551)
MRRQVWTILGVILGGAATSAAIPVPALAFDQTSPVCLRVYQSMVDFYDECGYTSMAQCQATASGRSAQCLENPYYTPQYRQTHRRAHRHHHSH